MGVLLESEEFNIYVLWLSATEEKCEVLFFQFVSGLTLAMEECAGRHFGMGTGIEMACN